MSSSTSWPRKDETVLRVLSFFFFFLFFNSSSWDRHGTAAGSQLLKRQWLLHKHYISKQMDRAGEGEEHGREEASEKTGKKTQITATGSNSHPSRVLYAINNSLVCFSLFLSPSPFSLFFLFSLSYCTLASVWITNRLEIFKLFYSYMWRDIRGTKFCVARYV